MKIILLQTGKTTERYISEGVGDFESRINRYAGFEILTLPDLRNTRNMPVQTQKSMEGKTILQSVNRDDFLVALDEKGKEFTTAEFTEQLEKIFMLSKKRVIFTIGGPYGLSDDVFKRADLRMSFSRLTFSHQLVRLLFAEQLYRALTIIKGDPYHHE